MRLARLPENLRLIPFLLIVAVLCPFAHGKVIYVDDDAAGANDGTSWTNAYIYLQDALADANESEKPVEIRVAQGIYKPDQGSKITSVYREATFQLINGVTLKGGHAGLGEPDPNARNMSLYETILSGDLKGDDVPVDAPWDLADRTGHGDNCRHVVTGTDTDHTAVLDGVTIRDGWAGGYFGDSGGGMYNLNGSPTVSNCIFENNFAGSDDLIFGNGAGMCNEYSNPTLRNCTFSRNCVGYSWGYKGDWLSITGGGIYNYYSNPRLTGCTFTGNVAFDCGGGMSNVHSSPELIECAFATNVSFGRGGAMYNYDSAPTLRNCRITVNVAALGGGAYLENGNVTLANCTLAGNAGVANGHTLVCDSREQGSPGRVAFTNCILWDGENAISNNDNSYITVSYSDVQYRWPGEGNIDVDPCFANPGYWDPNGTPYEAGDDSWVDGDYHLKSETGRWDPAGQSWVIDETSSPCIDAGDPNSPVALEPSPNGDLINMGAYGGTAEASKSPSGLHAPYGGGTGEPNDPYLIYTAEHLNALGAESNDCGKHVKLMADIDLSGYSYDRAVIAPNVNDTESDSQGIAFTGVFDGNRHTISHLTVSGVETLGLFGHIGEGGRVKNLGIEGVTVAGGDFSEELGGLAGRNEGEITDCYATGSVTGGADAADLGGLVGCNLRGTVANCIAACSVAGGTARQDEAKHLGGLVGWNDWGVISNCYATGEVTAGDESAGLGGLVGDNEQGTITDCHATGTVTGGDNSGSLGGLVGTNGDDVETGVITDCYASGNVIGGNAAESLGGLVGSNYATISGCYATGVVTGRDSCSQLGGLAGENWWGGNVTCCFAVGDVTGGNSSERIGGFAGTNGGEGTIGESYAAGSVRAGSDSHCLGGLVGENEGGEEAAYVRNCYSTANVTADAGSEEIGGLVGKNGGGDDPGSVRNCYSTGAVMAGATSGAIGGLVGGNIGHIRGSFWDIETSGLNTMCGRQDTHAHDCDNANGKTTGEMQTAKMFLDAGWDFIGETENGVDDTWWIDEGQDYPRLWWEPGGETP